MPSCATTRSLAARRFIALGIKPGDRIALVAETGPEFAAAFFGAVYAGAWPVPLPLPTSFGGREAYVDQLGVQLKSCDPALFLYPPELADFCADAADERRRRVARLGTRSRRSSRPTASFPRRRPDDIAYLQYSSGSTRFPHGVAVTHRALLDNLRAHGIGLQVARHRPLRLLAALVPRHGPGRLLPLADRRSRCRSII